MHSKLLSAVVAGFGTVLIVATPAMASEINWSHSYREAKKSVKGSDALLMLDFYTDW